MPRNLGLSFGGEELIADAEHRGSLGVAEAYRAASSWIGGQFELNRRVIDRLGDWLTLSCVLLAAEIILWTISLTN